MLPGFSDISPRPRSLRICMVRGWSGPRHWQPVNNAWDQTIREPCRFATTEVVEKCLRSQGACAKNYFRLGSVSGEMPRNCHATSLPVHLSLPIGLSLRFDPDATLMHQIDLAGNDLLAVLGVLHRLPVQVQILWINRLLV